MTSVNALRLDRQRGILLCDEASYWNEEWMILYTPDKIQAVVGAEIMDRWQTTLFLGMSGSSSMGERIIDCLTERIQDRFGNEKALRAGKPRPIVELLAHEAFTVATEVKAQYIDDFLMSRYGFTSRDIMAGSYEKNGKTVTLSDDDVVREAMDFLTFRNQPAEVAHVFKNTIFLAGYSPLEGFRMFFMNTLDPVCEEVAEVFINGGSGTDTNDLIYSAYAAEQTIARRRVGLDRTEAVIAAFSGLMTACRLSGGVAPYPNFIYLDGDAEQLVTKIFDRRSHLVGEAVVAFHQGLCERSVLKRLIDGMLFDDMTFQDGQNLLFNSSKDAVALERFLRGYPAGRFVLPRDAPVTWTVK